MEPMAPDTACAVFHSVSDTWAANDNVNRIYEICEEIFKMKQAGKSLKDYYGLVKGLREEPFFFINHTLKTLRVGRNNKNS